MMIGNDNPINCKFSCQIALLYALSGLAALAKPFVVSFVSAFDKRNSLAASQIESKLLAFSEADEMLR